ncbi:30S ribosomal protein S13 [Candidatus Woesebacteria bacterium RIFCSPHIGHO2_02_FULL_42_20]|uniref:Small ribosomal subunit protein uS13 n=1 Tax=Candidatus Woesebacteria bacterium RIFCSPHIGHO2_12_FULL_41_24 TaxID=1802510 RepID=A0A1F8APG8_9BACT|nr:MAG: 30S ribosomal protein S13 [Candidatus Woesebacteria bacterium RBG_16_41_13]OGM29256.1 MAG: 30S ribosomal protein S13 [Candidatus Woesebacteria bacterium RIFCSPHIGHO2_01_FULL_42_80]OGM34756.1 MAG: 30S ribosomal protein S13 [Candidatus Woesebacteria bacterium RIFCSPHIGHO2_02_FULL_42_20]OGM53657.1 MAG: 30S ribosomal protein S13 [Candidatus Woesebacteria bacterium RIFCSPHIGHO2_12_FULL_41_24]OGM67053.1 MAG: 30S ribosomal protein S13 [Candidatus Woesebacteria bacterium RIFCSPLOWO2_01_FULL_42_
MARIAGVELPENIKIDYALTKIHGIGWSAAKEVLRDAKVSNTKHVAELTPEEITHIASVVDKFPTEGELSRRVRSNIQRLQVIASYRGVRHNRGLPVRGQRTKTNARTKRGKRKTVGAFKKDILTKMKPGGEDKSKE